MTSFIQKLSLLLLFAVVAQNNLQAQETSSNNAKFGVKAGVNVSNLYTKDVSSENTLYSFNVGLFAKMPITSYIAVQPELSYTGKGASNTYNNVLATGKAKYSFNYIELPVLLVFNITNHVHVLAGPYIAYLISGSVKNDSDVSIFNFENNINTDDYNKFDTGLAVGVGVDAGMIGIGLRYNYGLSTVGKSKTYGGTSYTFPDGKNSVLSLNLTVGF
jgi:hypothetical protein